MFAWETSRRKTNREYPDTFFTENARDEIEQRLTVAVRPLKRGNSDSFWDA